MIQPIKQVSDRFSMPSLAEFYPSVGTFEPTPKEEKEARRRWKEHGGNYRDILAEVKKEAAEKNRIRKGHLQLIE